MLCAPNIKGTSCAGNLQLVSHEEMFNLKCKTCVNKMLEGLWAHRMDLVQGDWLDPPAVCLYQTHTLKQMMQSFSSSRGPFASWKGLAARSNKSRVWTFPAPLTQARPSGWETSSQRCRWTPQRCPGSRIISPVGHSLSTFSNLCLCYGKCSLYLSLYLSISLSSINQTSRKHKHQPS